MISELLLLPLVVSGTPDAPVDTTTFKNVDLQEVVISDSKQNQKNLTPTSVSRVDVRLLRSQQIVSPKDLSVVIPNFYMPDYGSRANTPVYIRGIGVKAKGSAVGYYVDGVPHFESSAFDFDLSEMAAVDVFRGPQGTLYGRNAIGGIVNVYSHNPLDYQNTRVKVGYGNYNDFVAKASNYTKLSNSFGFSVGGSYHHNDGMFKNAFLNDKADKMDEGEARIGLYWKPAAQWLLRLTSTFAYSDQGGYPYAPYDVTTGKVADVNYNRYSSFRRLISSTGFNAHYENDALSFNSQTSYQFIKTNMGIDQDFMVNDLYFVNNNFHQNMLSQEFTLKSNNNSRYQWIVGAFGLLFDSNSFVKVAMLPKKVEMPTDFNVPTKSIALYHQSSYNIWRGLSATIGARFDYEHAETNYNQDMVNLVNNGVRHVSDFKSKANFRQFTPKFTIQYLTTTNNLYYASVTRGYKPGGFNNSFKEDYERSYNPEYSWNYELGARTTFCDNKLSAELNLFFIDWRDMQTAYTVQGLGNVILNAGRAHSKGLEFALGYRPVKGLNLNLDYGYTHARYLKYVKSEKENYSHKYLPMVPNHTLALTGSYTVMPMGWLDRLVFSAGMTGVGRIYWTDNNAVSQNFYATLNAKVSMSKGIFTWEVWGKNLTATDYVAYGFVTGKDYYGQKGKPLTFGTSLEINL